MKLVNSVDWLIHRLHVEQTFLSRKDEQWAEYERPNDDDDDDSRE